MRAVVVSRQREMEENGPMQQVQVPRMHFLVLCIYVYMFYVRIIFLEFWPFYARIKHIRIKHKNILGKFGVRMQTCTTKTLFTYFMHKNWKKRKQRRKKLGSGTHMTDFFIFYEYMLNAQRNHSLTHTWL